MRIASVLLIALSLTFCKGTYIGIFTPRGRDFPHSLLGLGASSSVGNPTLVNHQNNEGIGSASTIEARRPLSEPVPSFRFLKIAPVRGGGVHSENNENDQEGRESLFSNAISFLPIFSTGDYYDSPHNSFEHETEYKDLVVNKKDIGLAANLTKNLTSTELFEQENSGKIKEGESSLGKNTSDLR
jgi:hypothetical protein